MNAKTLKGIKKWLSAIGILAIMSTFVVVAPVANAYSGDDAVAQGLVWAKDSVDAACEKGLIDCELPDAGFKTVVNRAVGYQMLTKGFDVYNENAMSQFPDVSGEWYEYAANTAYVMGWTAGEAGKFNGGGELSRAMMAVAAASVLGLSDCDATVLDAYTDKASVPAWATDAMACVVEAKLMGQGGAKVLNPNKGAIKAEVITILNAQVDYASEEGIDVMEVAAERLATDTDTLQEALDTGAEIVDGELVVIEGEEEIPTEEEETPVVAGTASVARASDTPAPTILATGTAFNKVLTLSVSAGSDADVSLTGITVTRGGLSANTWVGGVGVYDGSDVKHGNIGTSWNDNSQIEIDFSSEPIVIAKGTTVPVVLKANLAAGANSGTLTFSVDKMENIKSTAASLNGTFPITSNIMDVRDGANTVAAVTVDAVQVHNNGAADATAVSVNLGTTRQQLGTFRIANSAVEAVKLSSVTFYNNGSAADGDLSKITLVGPDGVDLKVVDKTTNKYVTFSGLSYELAKSASSKDFKVYADIVGGSTRTARLLIQNDYDLVLAGATSGSMILPTVVGVATPSGNDRAFPIGDLCSGAVTNYCNMVTVSAGTLSLSRAPTSPTGNIAAGGTGVVLGRWEIKATGEDMEIRQLSFSVTRSAATNLSGTFYLKIVDVGTLYSVAGSTAALYASGTYTTTFLKIKAGTTYIVEAVADVLSTATAGTTYGVTSLDITQAKRVSTNDIVDPAVNAVSANTLTVQSGTLSVTADAGAAAPQVVSGLATLTTLGTWNMTAGSAEGIGITGVILDDNTAGLGRNFKDLELWIDGAKKSQDTSTTQSPTATTATVTFNISPSYTIGASQTAIVEVKGKLINSTSDASVTMNIAASGITGNGVTSQSSLTAVPAAAVNGQVITISTGGTLTISRDTVSNVKSSQIVAGSTGVSFGAYKFQTGNIEDIRIKKVTLVNIGSNRDGLQNIGLYDGTTLLNDVSTTPGNEGILKASLGADISSLGNDLKSVTFDYSANPYVITKNSSKVLTVKANTVYSATSGQTVQFAIASIEAEGAGSSARIYATQTTELSDGAAANAWSAGQVAAVSSGDVGGAIAANGAGNSISPVATTGVAVGGALTGADLPFTAITLPATNRMTKLNTVMNGSAVVSEVPSAAATYPYAVGDVLAINDAGTVANTNVHVVTTAVAVGATLLGASTPVAGLTLAAQDRITRLPAGYSEAVSATATSQYVLGDILAVTDANVPANNGLYTVVNAVAVGGGMIGAAAANNVVALQSGATLTTDDRVTKMATQSTEVPSATAIYAYNLGDVIVVDDNSTPANNGTYVVRTAVAVGGSLLAADALGTGITFLATDRISKLNTQTQEDNIKRLYPTKLNFAWVAPAGPTLSTGLQIEVARFTMGADAANVNNPGTSVSVSALNFTEISSAQLTSYLLNDVTNGVNITANSAYSNSSSFSSAAAGGAMSAQTFQQGETRTYKLLADVGTSAGSQTVSFRFNSGSNITAGTATWTVGSETSTWTVLAGDVADLSSTTLTSASSGSDTTAPTFVVSFAGGSANNSVFDETITVTYNEKIDPYTINTSLTYAGSVAGVAATSGGGVVCPTAAVVTFTVTNVFSMTANMASDAVATNTTTTVALNAAGLVLTITPAAGYTAWHDTAATGDTGAQTLGVGTATVRDNAGNLVTATGSSITDADL